MAEKERFVVADGPIVSKSAAAAGIDGTKYVFQFSSHMFVCGKDVGGDSQPLATFVNNVRCRKWTNLCGTNFNTAACRVEGPEPSQPDKGCIVNVGDVTLEIAKHSEPPRRIVCPQFKLEGTQTHGIESSLVVFLFEGEGQGTATPLSGGGNPQDVTVRGIGRCPETLDPNGAPKVDSWTFIFTIC
jgi:hypothetical protein